MKNFSIKYRAFLFFCLLSAYGCTTAQVKQPSGTAVRPNIIFVLADDFAVNLTDFMPNLKAMQKDGVSFSNYYVSNSLCCPSRASIFTGRLPHNSKVETNNPPSGGYSAYIANGDDTENFAVALSGAGYKTAMMGKFLNEYQPKQHSAGPGWSDWFVMGNGYKNFNYTVNDNGSLVQYGNKPDDYLTDVLAQRTENLIRKWKDQPFFIEIASFTPHAPFTAAPRHEGMFNEVQAPRTPAFGWRADTNAPNWLKALQPLDSKAISKIDNVFRKRARAVQAIDEMLGRIRKVLAETGNTNKTYIFFSSDNGFHLGDYSMRSGKMTPYDIDIRVPLIVCGPDVVAGKNQEKLVSNIDLASTFTEIAGTTVPGFADGKSIMPFFKNSTQSFAWRKFAIIEHKKPTYNPNDPDVQEPEDGVLPSYTALRFNEALYVEYETGEIAYYDSKKDPYELNNIAVSLSAEQKSTLHNTIIAVKKCGGLVSCWDVQLDGAFSDNDTKVTNPVIDYNFPDPTVTAGADGYYYAFSTGGGIAKSTNLRQWIPAGNFIKQSAGGWSWGEKGTKVWAPCVVKTGTAYIMYYALAGKDIPNPGIGIATANTPSGPWVDKGKLFTSREMGVFHSIDPDAFTGQDGKNYLVWGSFRGIYITELTADGLQLKYQPGTTGNQTLIAGLDTKKEGGIDTYEGANVFFSNGYYYLFLSTGYCCKGAASTYKVVVCRAKSPVGPYTDDMGRSMLAANRGHPVVSGTEEYIGPGHTSVLTDAQGQNWLLYHSWNKSAVSKGRTMMIDRLVWNENGWPSTAGAVPGKEPFN